MSIPKYRIGKLRAFTLGASAAEFASMAQAAGCKTLTASRLRKIESGELSPRPDEKLVIAALLNLDTFEVFQ